MLRYLWISAVVLVLDQASKLAVVRNLAYREEVTLLPFLNFVHARNTGAAFGFLSGFSGWQNVLFVVIALVVSAMIVWWLWHLPKSDRLVAVAMALVLGGALGNVADRIMYGYVVDFIDVVFGSWHFWTFNVADSAISIGAVLLVYDAFVASAASRKA
jgi:signal peptidase II